MKQFKLKGAKNRAARVRRDNTKVKILSLPKDAAPDVVRLVEKFLAVRSKIADEHPELLDADSIYRLPWDAKKKFGTATMNTFICCVMAPPQLPPRSACPSGGLRILVIGLASLMLTSGIFILFPPPPVVSAFSAGCFQFGRWSIRAALSLSPNSCDI